MRKFQFLLVIFLLLSALLAASCVTINPPSAPTPAPEQKPVDIEAFISTPDWQPSYTIADLAQAKAELSNFFKDAYYAERPYIAEKYNPHDLAALKRSLSDMNQLPWKYKAGYFDCSEMSALVQLYLKVAGFDAVIVLGRDPEVQGVGHAWNTIFLQSGAVPIEPTGLCIPKATGNVYGQPPNQVVMNYEDYLRSGWVLRDIYEAWSWRPQEFDWWNSYALSMEELFGEPPAPTPTPTPSPVPPKPKPSYTPTPSPPPSQHKAKLMDETIIVSPGKWDAYSIAIDLANMPGCFITGSFTASGGSGNDIEFLVFDKTHYEQWKDEMEESVMPGHPEDVPALYRSGRVTTDMFDIPIARSDTYYLVWSNHFSTFSNKAIRVQVYLNYTK